MKNLGISALTGLFLLGFTAVYAQKVSHGIAQYDGDVNFTEMARWDKEHPVANMPRYQRDEAENDDMNEERANRPAPDPARVFRYHPDRTTGAVELPVSPSPADTFLSTNTDGNIPPDTHGCIGTGNWVVTADNAYIAIQSRTGAPVGTVALNTWWSAADCYDPRVHFDPIKKVWIMVTDYGGPGPTTESKILIAVSATSDPTGTWHKYSIVYDATLVNWLDFPNVGFNSKWVLISGNEFTMSSLMGEGVSLYAINYASMLAGSGAPFTRFDQGSSFSICPALTYDSAEANAYAVEVYNASSAQLQLWKISGPVNSPTMAQVGWPTGTTPWQVTAYDQNSPSSGTPPGSDFAPQLGTSNKVQTNDDRFNNFVMRNGTLWGSHTVFLPYSATTNPTRASVMWWQLDTNAHIAQNCLLDDATNTNFYAFPSLSVNKNNDVLIGFANFSHLIHPSASYALHMHYDAASTLRPPFSFKHGQYTYYQTNGGPKNRWGDYSGTSMDPINNLDFWTAQECEESTNSWNTWWASVTIPDSIHASADSVCMTGTLNLYDSTSGGVWSATNTNASVSATGVVTGLQNGLDTINYTLNNGLASTFLVYVKKSPAPVVTMGGHVLSVPAVYSSYQWQFDSTNITGATSNTYTFATTGYYRVIVDSNGCVGKSINHRFSLEVDELTGKEITFGLTPEGKTATVIASSVLTSDLEMSVFDVAGHKVFSQMWQRGTSSMKIEKDWLAPGLYLIRLSNSGTSVTLKWQKD